MIIKKIVGKVVGNPSKNENKNNKNDNDNNNKKPEINIKKINDEFSELTPNFARYRTHLQTDKNIYKPKEIVYVRGFIVNAFDHSLFTPLSSSPSVSANFNNLSPKFEIISPKGEKVLTTTASVNASNYGITWLTWEIPEGIAGGDYKIECSYPPNTGFAFSQREFNIRVFRPPRLKTHLEFVKKGYGAGETAEAKLEVERAEGGYPAGASVTAVARVDGEEAFRGNFSLDDNGKCLVSFPLPKNIESGVGTLSCVIEDGGVVETASKTIPILLCSIDINAFPEGGDLICGLENGLYVEAFTPVGDPADIEALVISVDKDGNQKEEVGKLVTDHEGRGKTIFTPAAGEAYHLKVVKPTGIIKTICLPEVKSSGVSLISSKKVFEYDEPIELYLSSTEEQKVTVQIFKLEKTIANTEVTFSKSHSREIVSLKPSEYDGVLRVTVSTSNGPVAERLIFRKPSSKIQFTITPDKKAYTPGGNVKLSVEAKIDGKPVKTSLGISVTDDSVRKLTEKRKRAPRLLPMVFLEDEVKELNDAHVYFKFDGKKSDKAVNAIDLLLGTQGWRRFVYNDPLAELTKNEKRGERLFAVHKAVLQVPQPPLPPMAAGGGPPGAKGGGPILFRSSSSSSAPAPPPPAPGGPPPPSVSAAPPPPSLSAAPPPPPLSASVSASVSAPPPIAQASRAIMADEAPQKRKKEDSRDASPRSKLSAAPSRSMAPPARGRMMGPPSPIRALVPSFARVFAHQVRPNRIPTERVDFAETLYWQASAQTDQDGKFEVEFGLNDSVTSFVVTVEGITQEGVLGQEELIFESKQPFYIEPKLPLEVTSGDIVHLPIAFINNTETNLILDKSINITGPISVRDSESQVTVPSDSRIRQLTTLEVGDGNGELEITIRSAEQKLAGLEDSVTRKTTVVPKGFPFDLYASGLIKANSSLTHTFSLPDSVIESSITTSGVLFTSPVSNMESALAKLIREPCGCFEQTSSTVYPLTMAQKYFKTHTGVNPDFIKRADEILHKGYKRLTGFECSKGGYDWFGSDPASEPLTSFGILEFTEMSKVMTDVSTSMIQRCIDWILDRRDGKGSFKINPRVLHTWSTETLMSDAYILYSLTKAGVKPSQLQKELDHFKSRMQSSEDPYLLALLANTLYQVGDKEGHSNACETIAAMQAANGSLPGAKTTVTRSGGKSLIIETTSLAMIAWLKNDTFSFAAAKGAQYLFANCEMGGYCNTQSTVLALEAIIDYDMKTAVPQGTSVIKLIVDNEVMQTINIDPTSSSGHVDFVSFVEAISLPGEHTVLVEQTGDNTLNYALSLSYSAPLPASSEECSVHIETLHLRDREITEGEGTEIAVKIRNKKEKEPLPMTMVIVGLPGGVDLRHEKMKELVKQEKIASYEVMGARRVACFFRDMQPNEEISFEIDVIAAVPGQYKGPASCAYLYYTNEHRHWIEGIDMKINPR